jgi:hypothetical protein
MCSEVSTDDIKQMFQDRESAILKQIVELRANLYDLKQEEDSVYSENGYCRIEPDYYAKFRNRWKRSSYWCFSHNCNHLDCPVEHDKIKLVSAAACELANE